MSTPPKEPKPDEVRRGGAATLESTYLGVAPIAPEPAGATGGSPPAAGGSAIIAAPMISVSDRNRPGTSPTPLQAAAPPAAPQAPAPAPARTSGLQGGWQSAGIPRLGPEQTALHGTPGAWPMPPQGTPPAPRPQPAAVPPRPTPAIVSPPAAAPAPVARAVEPQTHPGTGLQHTALASDYLRGARELALGGEAEAPRRPPAVVTPQLAEPPLVQHGAADIGRQTAYSPVSTPAPPRPHWQEPAEPTLHTQAPPLPLNATAASAGQPPAVSPQAVSPPTVSPLSPPPASPPPTKGPPPTAELSSPGPIPFQTTPRAPIQVFYAEPEPGHGPRSMGTQASVAPPPSELGASFHGPMAPAIREATPAPVAVAPFAAPVVPAAQVAAPAYAAPAAAPAAPMMAQVANPARHTIPQALAGTMLDRTPSIPGNAVHQAPPPPANPTLRFEQVPAPRSSLAQQGTAFNLHIPIDGGATQWGRTAVEPRAKAAGTNPQAKPRSQWRMVLLSVLGLMSVVFAAFGPELRDLAVAEMNRRMGPRGERVNLPIAATDQTTLTNLPSRGSGSLGAGTAQPAAAGNVAATSSVGAPVLAGPSSAGPSSAAAATAPASPGAAALAPSTTPGATGAEPGAVPSNAGPSSAVAAMPAVEAEPAAEAEPTHGKSKRGKDRDKAASEAAAAAGPESKLAAEAGKHVLAARFAEALPLYRALQRDYPQNSAYAAMTKVLEQKVGGTSPTGAQP